VAIRNQRAVAVGLLSAGLLLICSTASAQPGVSVSPSISGQPEAPHDVLGRNTPRGTVLGFLIAAREGHNESAAQYLNTNQRGKAAALLAHQLFIVLDRRLPAGLAQLSDRPEGMSPFQTQPDRNVIGTISSDGGNVDIIVERVSRRKDGLLWLFSGDTLSAVPRLYEEEGSDAIPIEDVIPKFLVDTLIARTPLYQWLALFVGMPLLYLFTVLLNRLLSPLLGQVRRRVSNREALPDPKILPVPVRLLFMALIIRWALSTVTLPLLAREFWTATAGVITIVACVWMLILLNGVGARLLHRRLERLPISILRLGQRAIDAVLLFVGLLAGFRYFGVNLTAALAGLGVGGIAIALAAQKNLENVIGGISVVIDRPARVGELVKVGDNRGFVEHVGLRSTRIRTLERTVVSIPNGQLANESLENISIRDKFWFHHTLRLRHETSVSTMREILDRVKNLLAQCPRVESGSVRVRFLGFGPSSLNVEIFVYVLDSNWNSFLETQENLLLDVMEIVQAAGTGLAYPSQTLYLARFNTPDGNASPHATTEPSVDLQGGRRHEAASGIGIGR
jgi:MscS family membrane protein